MCVCVCGGRVRQMAYIVEHDAFRVEEEVLLFGNGYV